MDKTALHLQGAAQFSTPAQNAPERSISWRQAKIELAHTPGNGRLPIRADSQNLIVMILRRVAQSVRVEELARGGRNRTLRGLIQPKVGRMPHPHLIPIIRGVGRAKTTNSLLP